MKNVFFLSIFTAFLLAGCKDRLEPSELDLINKVSRLDNKIKAKTDSLIEICANGRIIEYKGYVSPAKLADEILSCKKQKKEFSEIMEKHINITKTFSHKNDRR